MKLHLGCGQKYLEGYVNIDFPLDQHSVQKKSLADEQKNILELKYKTETVDEIRLHHVFEHFDRATACALLVAWNNWLKKDGILHIEVPDMEYCISRMLNPLLNANKKAIAQRHLFGSQEADWAVHYEGYSSATIKNMLSTFGFKVKSIEKNRWKGTGNISVIAIKHEKLNDSGEILERVSDYLRNYLVDNSDSELEMLKVWIGKFNKQLLKSLGKK